MRRPIATPMQQEECTALGKALLAQVDGYIGRIMPDLDADDRSREVGRMLVLAVFASGNEVEWLNRVFAIRGMGEAVGECCAQWPSGTLGLIRALQGGIDAGLSGGASPADARRAVQ